MKISKGRATQLVSVALMVTLPVLGMTATATAKTTGKAKAAKCAKHPGRATCQTAGGGGAAGTGGPTGAQLAVFVDPTPVVETGPSQIHAVIQVEASPIFAGDEVTISSEQILDDCAPGTVQYVTSSRGAGPGFFSDSITVALDDDGNATVTLYADDCAPGTNLIEADLERAPYLTATATLIAEPPMVTPEGLTGYPNNEVETGDTQGIPSPSGDSDVYAVFYVETNPVYAEDVVTANSPQLEARCGAGYWFQGGNGGSVTSAPDGTVNFNGPTTHLDNDGNAVFIFFGSSCGAGDSVVTADIEAGTHSTYSFVYTIRPEQVETI